MKRALSLVLFMALVAGFTANATAQDASNVSDSLDTLRSQLLDAQAKEAELEARQQQLDEALKPENIERSLAGIGSTKPEELRESRRRQLTIERDGVRAQLKLVATGLPTERIRIRKRATAQSSAGRETLMESWLGGWNSGSSRRDSGNRALGDFSEETRQKNVTC